MPVIKAYRNAAGGTLLIYDDGKKRYIPSKRYKEYKEKMYNIPKSPNGLQYNCEKFLCKIFGCSQTIFQGETLRMMATFEKFTEAE